MNTYIPSPTNIIKSNGIITLLAFSMPPATPNAIITTVTTMAIISHMLLPNALAVLSNMPPIADISCPIPDNFPDKARYVYLNIQPTTTV